MSRFRNEVLHLKAHVQTLRLVALGSGLIAMLLALGWWHAPRELTIHVPPDLRSGSTRKWWEVPPESVYAFAFYVFQQLHRWPVDGEQDYARNIYAYSAYLTPSCRSFLEQDFAIRRDRGELRQRVRGVYEVPGHGYGDAPMARVQVLSSRDWQVTLDLDAEEYFAGEPVKRAVVRYPLKVVRFDIDPQKNPWGLALDCYSRTPERLNPTPSDTPPGHATPSDRETPSP